MTDQTAAFVVIDREKCSNCKACEAHCPLIRFLGISSIEEVPLKSCQLCGHCIAACKNNAITHSRLRNEDLTVSGKIPKSDAVLNLIKARRYHRTFLKKKIRKEDMDRLIEAVRYSITTNTTQKINIVIIESEEKLKQIREATLDFTAGLIHLCNDPQQRAFFETQILKESMDYFASYIHYLEQQKKYRESGADALFFGAPALMLLTGPDVKFALIDSCLAAQSVSLLAPSLKMCAGINGLVTAAYEAKYPPLLEAVKDFLPENEHIFIAMIIGYEKYKFPYVPYRKKRKVIHV